MGIFVAKPIFHLIVVERKEFARSRYQDKTKSKHVDLHGILTHDLH